MNALNQPIETKSSTVKCDGGGRQLGHPAVFLNLGKEGKIICPYCSKSFVKTEMVKTALSLKKRGRK